MRFPVRWPAHPRVCGENSPRARGQKRGGGSSPRVRGKPAPPVADRPAGGLIPACAGKTIRRCSQPWWTPAHPRVCGENSDVAPVAANSSGSSPRVRGKLGRVEADYPLDGLIPACAGKTCRAPSKPPGTTAHPRVCGENATEVEDVLDQWGSSPRVRGKPCFRRARRGPHGLIPARAGKTSPFPWGRPGVSAHPRACGENGPHMSLYDSSQGSSPRVRGKRRACGARRSGGGLIPARAGKTTRDSP